MLQMSSSACILISEHQVAFDRLLNRNHQRDNVALTYGVERRLGDFVADCFGVISLVLRWHGITSFLMFGGTD